MNRLAQTPYVTRRRARRTTLAAALSWEAQNLSPLAAVLRENQTMASVCRVIGPYAESSSSASRKSRGKSFSFIYGSRAAVLSHETSGEKKAGFRLDCWLRA